MEINKNKVFNTPQLKCEYCGKIFKFTSALCKHLTVCKKNEKNILVNEQKNQIKNLQSLLEKTLETQTQIVNNLVNKVNHTTNNTMQINIFLDKECKNAMNFTDFIESLSPSIDDLKYTKDNGYIKGITNIFVKNLKDLRPKERPIYCSNVQDMEFYIKDKNKWQYDLQSKNIHRTKTYKEKRELEKLQKKADRLQKKIDRKIRYDFKKMTKENEGIDELLSQPLDNYYDVSVSESELQKLLKEE